MKIQSMLDFIPRIYPWVSILHYSIVFCDNSSLRTLRASWGGGLAFHPFPSSNVNDITILRSVNKVAQIGNRIYAAFMRDSLSVLIKL